MDPRIKLIESETRQEAAQTNTKFAFSGFGRSTVRLEDVVKVGKAKQERIANIEQILAVEARIRAAKEAQAPSETLTNMRDELRALEQIKAKMDSAARQRRAKLYGETVSVGRLMDSLIKRKSIRASSYKKPRSFKLKVIKPLASQTVKPLKGLQPISMTGRNVPSFSSKFNLSRLRSFGAGRNLSGKFA